MSALAPSRSARATSASRRSALAALALLALAAAAGCGSRGDGVTGSGTIEMDEVDVASQVGGRIVRLTVEEGDTVRVGDTLAVLDQGEVLASLEARGADAARAVAQLRDLQAGARSQELKGAQADVEAAVAQAQLAAADAARAETLYQRHVISQADLDRARTTRDAAVASRASAKERYDLLKAGSRGEQVRAAREAESSARAQLEAARSRAEELVLVAPIRGVVLLRNLNLGELAPANVPVVTLGDPQRLWLRVYVGAPLIGRVRRGDPATIRVTGDPRTFHGRVIEIASKAEFTPRAALTEEERANLVFAVKIEVDSEEGALKPGLPADARIMDGDGAGAAPARRGSP